MALSPAEALVLLDPNAEQGVQAAKVTFLGCWPRACCGRSR